MVSGSSGTAAATATPTTAPIQATATPTTALIEPTAMATTVNSGSGSEVTYDDTDGVSFSSGWISVDSGSAYNGSYSQTSTDGASATFNFTGSSFSVVYKGGPSYRLMNVLLDGSMVGTIYQQRVDSTYDL